jgi:TRAP-type C4-dicarboxylate transport system substrate-binding protein
MRAWAWPEARALNELLFAAGAYGVLLRVPEVYPALQSGFVDMVTCSCVALQALRWQGSLRYVTKASLGVLPSAMLLTAAKWQALPAEITRVLQSEVARSAAADVAEVRRADDRACQSLVKRGYIANDWTGDAKQEADAVYERAQKRLIGRMYTAEQLEHVKALADGG